MPDEPIETPPLIPKKIAAALVKVQKGLMPLKRSAANDEFGSRYTPLEEVMTFALSLLNKEGIAVSQPPTTLSDGTSALMTILVHKDGDIYQTTTKIAVPKVDPQAHASAITYMRRKALESILGITSEGEDDDGNRAAGRFPKPTDEQIEQIKSLCLAMKYPAKQIAAEVWKVKTADHAALVIRNLNQMASQRERDNEARDRASLIENGVGPGEETADEQVYISYDDPLIQRMINLGCKTKADRNRFVRRITKKPFLDNCSDEERKMLDDHMRTIEGTEYKPDNDVAQPQEMSDEDKSINEPGQDGAEAATPTNEQEAPSR
ncbi:ERF family protein [Nocardia rhizosphaerihabitans]|uniref:ERF family protein n=1 Tax=Nocardia rhizosphaerihabitans TaxID=1691570 RepID=UPI00366BB64C